MYFYIIYFSFYFVVKGHDSSSSEFKYVDLLPEKEKHEFLEQVARRILSEIKPTGTPQQKSTILTDTELNENSNYVNKVLKEESLKFESTRTTPVKDTNSIGITEAIKRDGAVTDEAITQYVENVVKLQAKDVGIDSNNTKDEDINVNFEKSSLPTETSTSSIPNLNLPKFGNAAEDILRSHVDLTLIRKKRIRRHNENEKPNPEESKNINYEQVPVKIFFNTTEKQVQSQELNSSSPTETKQSLDDFEGINDFKDTKISVIQNLNQTKLLTNASPLVERSDNNKSLDSIIPADSKSNKTTSFKTGTEEHVDTNNGNGKNYNPQENLEESKNENYEQVSLNPVSSKNELKAQSQELDTILTAQTKQLSEDLEESNDHKATTITVMQNVNYTKVLRNALVERTDKNKSSDLIIPADSKRNKTNLFETVTEEYVDTNNENGENYNPGKKLEKSKIENDEQVSLNPVLSTNELNIKSQELDSISTTQTKQLPEDLEESNDHKITTIAVMQNVNHTKEVRNASALDERTDKNNNLDLTILADSENNKTTLFETATKDFFYASQNKSTVNDLLKPENVNNISSKTSAIEITGTPANPTGKIDSTKPLTSLDSESVTVTHKLNEAKPEDSKKYENIVKDITPNRYLEILSTKYVETLPPELDHVEVQIPKSVINKDNNLSPLEKNVPRYDVFEVEPDKSSFQLVSANSNKNNQEAPYYAPVQNNQEAPYYAPIHDYAPENAYFNAFNRLGSSNNDKDHNVLEVEPDQFYLRSPDSEKSNQEEPYFAPIHNYEPINAYFNPKNRLGPNYDNEDQSENSGYKRTDENVANNNSSEDYLRSGKTNNNINKKHDLGSKTNDQKFKAVSVNIPVYMKKSKTTIPDGYLDMDYFLGRSQTGKKYSNVDNFIPTLPSIEVRLKNNLKAKLKRDRIKSRTDLVSRILKEIKEEEKSSRNGQGFAADYYWSRLASGSIENEPKFHSLRSYDEKENFEEAKRFLLDLQVFGNNYVDYDELPTKDAYFKQKKEVKVLSPKEISDQSAEIQGELSKVKEKLPLEALSKIIKEIIKLLPPRQIRKLKNFKPTASKEAIYNELLPLINSAAIHEDVDSINLKDSQKIIKEYGKQIADGIKRIVDLIIKRIPQEDLEKIKNLKNASTDKKLKEVLPIIFKPKNSQGNNEDTLKPTKSKENNDGALKPKGSQEKNNEMVPKASQESKNEMAKPKDIDELNVDVESKTQVRKRKNKYLRVLEEDFDIEPYVEAMENLIKNESEGLKKYNWLGTTVDLQGALDKLIDLTESDDDEDIHPDDKSIVRYTQFLYESAQGVILADSNADSYEYNPYISNQRYQNTKSKTKGKKKSKLPRNKKRNKYPRRDAIQMMNDIYKLLRIVLGSKKEETAAASDSENKEDKGTKREELQHFLVDLRSGLSEFHNALKHISLVTKYEKQNWYKNLKELYLGRPKRKQVLEILLHMFSIRLFDRIEASAKNGVKNDVLSYVLKHKEEVQKTKEELVLVIKLLNEIKVIDRV